jgi:hypothetical protein
MIHFIVYETQCYLEDVSLIILLILYYGTCSIDTLWEDVHVYLKVFQTMACLEIVHSMVGLVKSPWFTTFMQGSWLQLMKLILSV